MGGALLVMGVGLGIASMAFILLFMLLRETEVTRERLERVLGAEVVAQLERASTNREIEEIIRKLSWRQKSRLKTLLESQDIRDAVWAIRKYLRGEEVGELADFKKNYQPN
jgi:(p)ppGpp synthase/HD superfamily hydrolase